MVLFKFWGFLKSKWSWSNIIDLKKFPQPPCLRDDCVMQPFICTSVQQKGWFGQRSHSSWIRGAVWDLLEQGMPGVGVTPVAAAPLPAAHEAAPLVSPLGPCSEAKPTLGYVESAGTSFLQFSKCTETRTFLITQKNIKPGSLQL